ncbi:MAG: helix-turn-helix transcriptional regulator [Thiohalomonadaceae bacterium]|nr:helix-turn-helix domain-containing protein [Thiopseudomonas sp.]
MNDKSRVGITSFPAVLGTVIANLRKEMGIGQAELAQKIGITASTLSRIENGESAMTIDQLYITCNFLGIKPHELLAAAEKVEEGLQNSGVEAVREQAKLSSLQSKSGTFPSPAVLKGASLLPFALPFIAGPVGLLVTAALAANKLKSKTNNPSEPNNENQEL